VITGSRIHVLSDEIYESLVYDDTRHVSIASLGPDIFERTIVVNGMSKSYAMTGWRVGYAAGPKEVIKAAMQLQSHSTSNPASISQKAALAALRGDQQCVQNMREEFDTRRRLIVELLRNLPGITCLQPKGAFYALPNVSEWYGKTICGRKVTSSLEFAAVCLEEAKIAVVPGSGFGDDRVVRISYATSMESITEGISRLRKILK